MKVALLVALIASLFIATVYSTCSGPCCDPKNPCDRSATLDVSNSVPSGGFLPHSASQGCLFNCEWFVRTARRDNPSKPCVLQRGRNGRFKDSCVQEQVCSGCANSLVMLRQPFYLTSSDVNVRCPKFPEDLDAFTTAQLTVARDICKTVGRCSCVAGDISPEVLSVRE